MMKQVSSYIDEHGSKIVGAKSDNYGNGHIFEFDSPHALLKYCVDNNIPIEKCSNVD